ncbi:hypothetical protein ACH5RR_028483 [Cinchona calisaya]|uniref:F-box domain-containing protein n=1 Tax=Cinchona calisaya TaxID=153742 RepID=A0ABD2YNX6_9GENT
MSDYIPEEVLINILQRLPVKPLGQFTAVCKSWYSLITSPHFISTHLNHQTLNLQNQQTRIIFGQYNESPRKEHVFLYDKEFSKIEFPFSSTNKCYYMTGSINGLICLCDNLLSDDPISIILWNPSIKKSVFVPTPNVRFSSVGECSQSLAFG